MLTFFYRHMRPLMREGKIYLAQPPLYRLDIGKETHWAHDDTDRDKLLAKHTGAKTKVDISRFKGLGEMMPKVLWNTTLNPKTRALLRVDIEDGLKTEQVISDLMGKDPHARFTFIMERAEEAEGDRPPSNLCSGPDIAWHRWKSLLSIEYGARRRAGLRA